MEHIKEMLSDNENIRQKLFKFDFDIVGGITKKCISCNKNNKIMDNYGVMCQTKECYKYVSADDYNVLYNKAKLFEIIIEHSKNMNNNYDISVLYKIRIDNYFGIMTCIIQYEPNEWNSSPHDDYMTKVLLFNDEMSRNKEYETL